MKLRAKFLILPVVMCGVVIVGLAGCGQTEIDLSKYAEVTFSGIDGDGVASCDLDNDGISDEIATALFGDKYDVDIDDVDEKMFVEMLEEYDKVDSVLDSIDVSIDKSKELTNGDKVTLTITADEEIAKENKIKFVGTGAQTFTVSGLTEKIVLDAFDSSIFNVTEGEGIYVEFTGISPQASLQIRNTLPSSNPLSQASYKADIENISNIKKGDEIKISVTLPLSYEDEGYVLEAESTTVTCEYVDEYITSLDDIDDETWDKIKAQCDDIKTAKLDSRDNSSPRLLDSDNYDPYIYKADGISDFKYGNAYFLSLKDGLEPPYSWGRDLGQFNSVLLSYSLDVNKVPVSFSSETKDYKGYIGTFVINDLVKTKDGEVEFTADMVSVGNYLYADENTMKVSVVNPEKDKFTVTEEGLNW